MRLPGLAPPKFAFSKPRLLNHRFSRTTGELPMSAPTITPPSPASAVNPLKELGKYGQSVWLDYIRRTLIASGELKHMIDSDGLGGVTSNPAIFEKAITGSTDYADALHELQKEKGLDAMAIYERIAIKD